MNQNRIPEDNQLILAIREGETAALGMLVARHREYAARIASRFLLADDDICEVVQDAFVRVWRHAGEFDSRNRFTTWFYTIVFNLCLDRLKSIRRKGWRTAGLTTSELDLPATPAETSGSYDNEVITGAVRAFAAELGEAQRTVFVLRDLQDLPVEEVCRMTGFDAVKVKTNLYHARKYVRERLMKGGYL
jgi:RNA polymerase sigma-70 factor (ECF subfamily)